MPFLYVPGTNRYTSCFMRDINRAVSITIDEKDFNGLAKELHESLRTLGISPGSYHIKKEKLSSTAKRITVTIRNQADSRERAVFSVQFGYKDIRKGHSYWNMRTNIQGCFIHPTNGSKMWAESKDTKEILCTSDVINSFKSFVSCAQDKFRHWSQANNGIQNGATLDQTEAPFEILPEVLAAEYSTWDPERGRIRSDYLATDRVKEIIQKRFPHGLHGIRVLEPACGTGELTLWLAKQGAIVTAFDLLPRQVERARAKLETESDEELKGRVRFYEGDITDMSFLPSGEKYDLITTLLMHLYLDERKFRASFEQISNRMRLGAVGIYANDNPSRYLMYLNCGKDLYGGSAENTKILNQHPSLASTLFVEEGYPKDDGSMWTTRFIIEPTDFVLNCMSRNGLRINEVHLPTPTDDELAQVPQLMIGSRKMPPYIIVEYTFDPKPGDSAVLEDNQNNANPLFIHPKETQGAIELASNYTMRGFYARHAEPAVKELTQNTSLTTLEELPINGTSTPEIIDHLVSNVFPLKHDQLHPRYFHYVPAGSTPLSVSIAMLAKADSSFAGNSLVSPEATKIELSVVDWMRRLTNFPEGTGGVFVSGGTEANGIGLQVARYAILDDDVTGAVIYCSDQTHNCIDKELRRLGFSSQSLRVLEADSNFCLSPELLEEQIKRDLAHGLKPFCVVSNLGTTSTGVVDPIPQIAEICKRYGMWHHGDATYGCFVFSDKFPIVRNSGAYLDSIVLGPHKSMFVPYGNGLVLVRDLNLMRQAFHTSRGVPYLKEYSAANHDSSGMSTKLTSSFENVLQLYALIKKFGIKQLGKAQDYLHELAKTAATIVQQSQRLQLVTGPNLSVITFRYSVPGLTASELNKLNADIRNEVSKTGFAEIGQTELNGNLVLRMCMVNPATTEDDIIKTLELVKNVGARLSNIEAI